MAKWVKLAAIDAVAEGEVIGIECETRDIALYQLDGQFHATGNICTHAYARLCDGYLDDGTIECPIHAGRFDVKTGKALGPPVTQDLRVYSLRIDGGDILIDLG